MKTKPQASNELSLTSSAPGTLSGPVLMSGAGTGWLLIHQINASFVNQIRGVLGPSHGPSRK